MTTETLREVVLASGNAGKLREFSAILQAAGIRMVAQSELGVPEADEPHATFVENALAKARHASLLSGRPALADDSGLCVPALGGAPGVYSARTQAWVAAKSLTKPTICVWSASCRRLKTTVLFI